MRYILNLIDIINKNKIVIVGLIIFLIFFLIAIFVPYMGLISPVEMSPDTLAKLSNEHILGTNDIGQDIFSRLLYSARQSIYISLMVGIISTFIATFFGCMSALKGGKTERFILRITEIMLALPELVVCLLISSYVRPTAGMLIVILSLIEWSGPLKIIRAQALVAKRHQSISAAMTFGASNFYILIKHIIPEILPVIVSTFIRCARVAVFMESGMAFLGLVDAGTISWGRMIADSMKYTYLPVWKNWLLPVGIVLSILLVSLSYIGYYFENCNLLDRRELND